MTNEKFRALVERLEQQARARPAAYQTRVVLLAMLGNAYLTTSLALIVALFAAAIGSIVYLRAFGLKLALVIGVFLRSGGALLNRDQRSGGISRSLYDVRSSSSSIQDRLWSPTRRLP